MHFRFFLLAGWLSLMVSTGAELSAQSTVFNEIWAQGTRATQNPPNSLRWFATTAAAITQSNGTATINDVRQLAAHFPAQTLAVGGTLTLSFTFSVAGPLYGNADVAGFTGGLRCGLFSTGGNAANLYTADGQNGNVTSTGFMALVDSNPDPGAVGAGGLRLLKRFGLANTLTTTTGMVTASPINAPVAPRPFTTGAVYNGVLVVRSASVGSTTCTLTITGPGLPAGYAITIDDDGVLAGSGNVPAAIGALKSFDTVAFAIGSSTSIAGAAAWTLGPVKLTYAAPGAPGTITSQPANQIVRLGGSATFSVTAAGSGNSYQWSLDQAPIPGATAATLALANVQVAQSGAYAVTVSNGEFSTSSNPAMLGVLATGVTALNPAVPPGRNFDLTRWGTQLPIKTPEDPTGRLSLFGSVDQLSGTAMQTYTSPWFYTNPGDGAMRFYAPITGDRLSDFPRSELRESYTATQSDWFESYGTATLNATVRIHQVPDVTKSVIIGQIKSVNGVTNVGIALLRYTAGAIYADVGFSPGSEGGTRLTFPHVGAAPTDLISYQLKTVPGAVLVTVNGTTQAALIDDTRTGWPAAAVYFKAGDYCQGNPQTEGPNSAPDNGASTAFHALNITHITSTLRIATTALPDGAAAVPYAQTLQAGNSSGALTWSLLRGVVPNNLANATGAIPMGGLPPGLTLSRDGVISGTPDVYDAGKRYDNIALLVTDATGASAVQTLSIAIGAAPNPGRLINLSILTSLDAPGDSFTMGAVIGGAGTTGTKALLVRAAGPALSVLGVGNPLRDPFMEFFSGETKAGENDDWGGATALSAAFTAVGAFPYAATTSKDAAIFNGAATAGNTSVRVTGVGGATGAVIAEIYDSTPAVSFTPATPRLINVSVFKQIGSGFTMGFVIGGATNRTVLVRAIGPGLAAVGVMSGFVPDPKLDVFSGDTRVNGNDNWGGTKELSDAFTSVGAFMIPAASKDAAVLAALSPGTYTVKVSGVDGGAGMVIVEVYEVP